jgi:hypothetical protein
MICVIPAMSLAQSVGSLASVALLSQSLIMILPSRPSLPVVSAAQVYFVLLPSKLVSVCHLELGYNDGETKSAGL